MSVLSTKDLAQFPQRLQYGRTDVLVDAAAAQAVAASARVLKRFTCTQTLASPSSLLIARSLPTLQYVSYGSTYVHVQYDTAAVGFPVDVGEGCSWFLLARGCIKAYPHTVWTALVGDGTGQCKGRSHSPADFEVPD